MLALNISEGWALEEPSILSFPILPILIALILYISRGEVSHSFTPDDFVSLLPQDYSTVSGLIQTHLDVIVGIPV